MLKAVKSALLDRSVFNMSTWVTHTHTHTQRERERERERQTDRQTDMHAIIAFSAIAQLAHARTR